jgi:hypothetical protein
VIQWTAVNAMDGGDAMDDEGLVLGVVLAFSTAYEIGRTLYAWHRPAEPELGSEAEAAQKMIGLTDELHEARRHRNVELAILAFVGALQVVFWIVAVKQLSAWRWLYYAFIWASLLLVGIMRRRAFRRLQLANAHAIQLLEQALALKAERNEGEDPLH